MFVNVLVIAITMFAAVGLVATQPWHGRFSMDNAAGVQNHHKEPTSRIGGVAIALGLVSSWVLATPDVRTVLGPMLLAGIPAFLFGLLEDLTKQVGVLPRLLATVASGLLAWYLTGIAMQNTGLPPLDWLLAFTPIAVLFTAFAVGGVANALNIIDGFNGLAAGAIVIMMGALGLIAADVGDSTLASVCFLLAFCALGFCVVNWPLGPIFLGDGGAYLLGFCLAWLAVLLPMRNPQINAWVSLLVCSYPVLEVVFSVQRRRRRIGHHPGEADKCHLHHFMHRRVVCKLFPHMRRRLQNGMTSPLGWICAALPAAWAVVFAESTVLLAVGFVLAIFSYAAVYARLTQFRWCFSARTMRLGAVSSSAST